MSVGPGPNSAGGLTEPKTCPTCPTTTTSSSPGSGGMRPSGLGGGGAQGGGPSGGGHGPTCHCHRGQCPPAVPDSDSPYMVSVSVLYVDPDHPEWGVGVAGIPITCVQTGVTLFTNCGQDGCGPFYLLESGSHDVTLTGGTYARCPPGGPPVTLGTATKSGPSGGVIGFNYP